MKAAGNLAGRVREFISQRATGDSDAVIDGGTARSRLQAGLGSQIVPQRRFVKVPFGHVAGVMHTLPPAEKVQQVVSIDAQGRVRQAADVLAVQITIDPADFPTGGLFDDTNRTLCRHGRLAGRGRGTSWPGGLQKRLELARVTALDEEGVRIVALGQHDAARFHALRPETMC